MHSVHGSGQPCATCPAPCAASFTALGPVLSAVSFEALLAASLGPSSRSSCIKQSWLSPNTPSVQFATWQGLTTPNWTPPGTGNRGGAPIGSRRGGKLEAPGATYDRHAPRSLKTIFEVVHMTATVAFNTRNMYWYSRTLLTQARCLVW